MKAVLKAIFIAVGLLLLILAAVAIVGATQADKIARERLQRTLSYVFKSEVTVEAVAIEPMRQALTVTGIRVANPPGFSAGAALALDRADVEVEARTLLTETPVVSNIVLSGVRVNLEYATDEGVNVAALLREAERTNLERKAEQPRGARREYLVKRLTCDGARIEFSGTMVPGSTMGLDIAPFTLEDVSREHPVTAGQLSAVFIKSLLKESLTFKGLLRPVGEFLQKELDRLMN